MAQANDMCVPCGKNGLLNIRVGALIVRGGKMLMVENDDLRHVYTVGGRIKMGETAEQAIVREVSEETGVRMTVDRLAFIHENYFTLPHTARPDEEVYEISYFFIMNVPTDFEIDPSGHNDLNEREYLAWVSPDTELKVYPEFFRTEALSPPEGVKFFSTDDRIRR